MGKTDTGTHVLLSRDFAATRLGDNGMPAPRASLIVSGDTPHDAPTIKLMPGLLSYYPLVLTDILKGDVLRAYFDFHCEKRFDPLTTCFDRAELDVRENELIAFAGEPIAHWNLVQIRMAKIFMDNAPEKGRAVSLEVISDFNRSPHHYYAMMAMSPTARPQ